MLVSTNEPDGSFSGPAGAQCRRGKCLPLSSFRLAVLNFSWKSLSQRASTKKQGTGARVCMGALSRQRHDAQTPAKRGNSGGEREGVRVGIANNSAVEPQRSAAARHRQRVTFRRGGKIHVVGSPSHNSRYSISALTTH